MKASFLIAAASGVLLVSASATAQMQSQPQQGNVLNQLLGAMFGTDQQASEQVLDSDWNQGRRPFEQRRTQFDARIDMAVREGSMSRREAEQVRREYDDIVQLEAQYLADGNVSQQQRNDLRARYRALSQRVDGQQPGGNDDQGYNQGSYQHDERWQPLSMRYNDFEQRISAGLRSRQLTQLEATRLRTDWRSLAQVEANYQQGGIDAREQADLSARYDNIEQRLGGGGVGNNRNRLQWGQLETRLTGAERNGILNRNETAQLRSQLGDLVRLDQAYERDGYTIDERGYLAQRYRDLDAMLGYNRR